MPSAQFAAPPIHAHVHGKIPHLAPRKGTSSIADPLVVRRYYLTTAQGCGYGILADKAERDNSLAFGPGGPDVAPPPITPTAALTTPLSRPPPPIEFPPAPPPTAVGAWECRCDLLWEPWELWEPCLVQCFVRGWSCEAVSAALVVSTSV